MSGRSINRQEFFASLGRSVVLMIKSALRSRIVRGLIALAVASASICLARFCWEARDFLVAILGIGFVYFGLLFAWELFPFSEQTRARWTRQRELADRYVSYRWRNCLWYGLGFAALQLWGATVSQTFDPKNLIFPAGCIVVGAVAQWIWHRHSENEDADAR